MDDEQRIKLVTDRFDDLISVLQVLLKEETYKAKSIELIREAREWAARARSMDIERCGPCGRNKRDIERTRQRNRDYERNA